MKLDILNNLISIDNYIQIKQIENDLIVLEEVKIIGRNLKIKYFDKYKIVIEGLIYNVILGE